MDRKKLERDLEDLQTEISNIEGISPAAVNRLEEILADLHAAASFSAEDAGGPDARAEDLRGRIESFEVEHPAVTKVLGRVAKLLSDMGI